MSQKHFEKRKAVIFGARGYAGLDLARILLKHPGANLVACLATDGGFRIEDYLPEAEGRGVRSFGMAQMNEALQGADVAFLATPAEASIELAGKILAQGVKVIDLSGGFRLKDLTSYPKWYRFEHPAKDLKAESVYGLNPWSENIASARLIANPGCYATATLMALLPLLREKLIKVDTLVVDAKSGATGAGKKAAENLLFTEVDGECLAYRIGKHQHVPEIVEAAELLGGAKALDFHFSTTLLPVRRGIIAGVYARLAPGVTLEQVGQAYARAYEGYPLVRLGRAEVEEKRPGAGLLSLKRVAGSARTHIVYGAEGDKLFVHSLIDNLLKGAASQAVENFNRISGFAPAAGLTELEGVL